MNNYDGLYILNIQGKDEGIKEAIETIEKEIEGFGGKVHGTQKMDRRRFERVAGDLDSGFYVNIQFSVEPDKIEALRGKLALNEIVYRQFYLKQEAVAA
ncbi:MAG: 30S ribosomal protein S6 [Methylacidiphilales bacterium]|nr:30S ribosomal protein S6 [Candidatus Methylacidiphilales bacterium]